jgi:hypothetical protein
MTYCRTRLKTCHLRFLVLHECPLSGSSGEFFKNHTRSAVCLLTAPFGSDVLALTKEDPRKLKGRIAATLAHLRAEGLTGRAYADRRECKYQRCVLRLGGRI